MKKAYSFNEYISIINSQLDSFIPDCTYGEPVVGDAMKYSLGIGGKRIRPVLLLEFCRVCGGDVEKAIPFAAALEMIHTYSLIHDDLPCMDNDDMRRGQPSCHIRYGEEYALLAGDGLPKSFIFAVGKEGEQVIFSTLSSQILMKRAEISVI